MGGHRYYQAGDTYLLNDGLAVHKTVKLRQLRGRLIEEIGCFSLEPIPPNPFRLRCRPGSGPEVVTRWITL